MLLAVTAQAQTTNSWITSFGDFWHSVSNWSLVRIPTNSDSIFITNASTSKVIIINSITAGTTAMTINNLRLSTPFGSNNVLSLTDPGTNVPLRILNTLTITSGGVLLISNGVVRSDSAAAFANDGEVLLNSPDAWLIVTNKNTEVGSVGVGKMTVSNGTVLAKSVFVANSVGSRGTLTIAGGTYQLSLAFIVSGNDNATGTVWMTGGRVIATNGATQIGAAAVGRMAISNGIFLGQTMVVGSSAGGQGTLTIAGGTNAIVGPLRVGSLDATGTIWITGGQLVVTNNPAMVGAGSGFVIDGTVTVTNGSAINVSNVNAVVGNRSSGSLTLSSGSFSMAFGNLFVGGSTVPGTGSIWVDGSSSIVMTNPGSSIFLGTQGTGQMTISNGTVSASAVIVGNVGPGRGTLTIAGGTMLAPDGFDVGESAGSTGAVWMTSGTLLATNSSQLIGLSGVGQMAQSNGIVQFRRLVVGSSNIGTFTMAGGTNTVSFEALIGSSSTGTLWLTGGRLVTTNTTTMNIGRFSVGRMSVSNGTWLATNVTVGANAGAQGTLTVAGGTNTVYSNLILGTANCTATGTVIVAGGRLFVTNNTATAVLDVRSGTLTLNSGVLTIDTLVMTNACGHFVLTAGSFNYSNAVLSADLDADGDGIPNGWESQYGFAALYAADAGTDPDGDGFTNLQEYLAGTDPLDSASFLGITAITRESNDIRVTWMTGIGKTNALERTAGTAGSYDTNSFAAIFTVTNTVGTTTNVLDIGAATNVPAFYYRVRLVP